MRFYRKRWLTDEVGAMLSAVRPSPHLSRLRQIHHELRTEGNTPSLRAVAVGAGVFIGCTPFYGGHLAISYLVARLLGVSRLVVYLAANISNPLVAPVLLFAEVQTGAWIVRGRAHPLTIDAVRTLDLWSFGQDLLVGTVVVGSGLGLAAMVLTWALLRRTAEADAFGALAEAAADGYLASGITAWEFARGKLKGDPVYRDALLAGALPAGGTLVDFGCGQGLMLALLLEAAAARRDGRWPGAWPDPPVFDTLIGVDPRPNVVGLARAATGGRSEIHAIDGRAFVFPACDVVLFFDVLQMMPYEDQERLLERAAQALRPGGALLVREADASAGQRFLRVRVGNRLKALAIGAWRQPLCYRRAEEWRALFTRLDLESTVVPSSARGHFGNLLFRLSRRV